MNQSAENTPFRREVTERFGLVPNFFAATPDAPEMVEKLWQFAKSAYIENPMPSLFKERLFVFLSRFCEVRYCITRHCAFLLGYGHVAGDPTAPPQSLDDAARLLTKPTPWQRTNDDWLRALESAPTGSNWPTPDTDFEDQLFAAAALVFVEARRSGRARRALRRALGGPRYEHLLGLIAFIRTAHYWTVLHPDLAPEEDIQQLIAANAELARLLLDDSEASRCDLGTQLYAELEELRDLHERRSLEIANEALTHEVSQKEFLLKEVNHRVKNSLQIVSSILHLEIGALRNTPAAEAMHNAINRVMAIAAVHERLYTSSDLNVIELDIFLTDLCGHMGQALGCSDNIKADLAPVKIPTDMAIPLALIVNELVTNAIKYGGPSCVVSTTTTPDAFLLLTVSDSGRGPQANQTPKGMGSRIIAAFAKNLNAVVEHFADAGGYTVTVSLPLSKSHGE
jgi:two-component sensor histidine kinase